MAGIDTNSVTLGFKKGSTWGTAVSVTSTNAFLLRASSLTFNHEFETITSRDIGVAKKITDVLRGRLTCSIQITCDLTPNQPWLAILAGIMGTESTPAEVNVGQADYSRNLDLANSTYGGAFWTIAWTTEDATYVMELPSVKFNAFTINMVTNEVGSITFNGVFNRVIHKSASYSPATTYAHLTGLSATSPYELVPFGNTNHYCRINAAGGAALDASNDMTIESLTFGINRPIQPQHVLRGANSKYIVEPRELGSIQGFAEVRLGQIAEATLAMTEYFQDETFVKMEAFIDGSIIGAGANRSLKAQFPRMDWTPTFPNGFDIPNNSSLMVPTIRLTMVAASSAPSGMSGVTDYLRVVSVDGRSTKWTA